MGNYSSAFKHRIFFAVNKDNEGDDDDDERKEGRKMEDFNCAFKVISVVEDRAS